MPACLIVDTLINNADEHETRDERIRAIGLEILLIDDHMLFRAGLVSLLGHPENTVSPGLVAAIDNKSGYCSDGPVAIVVEAISS